MSISTGTISRPNDARFGRDFRTAMAFEREGVEVALREAAGLFLLSDVYYAGGTVDRVVTSEDVAAVMQKQRQLYNAFT